MAELQGGKVATIRAEAAKPFGFIAREAMGGNVYFNADSLGDNRSWDEFYAIACKFEDCHAPVTFRVELSRGKEQAVGVVIHEPEEAALLDADGDGHVTEEELQAYLKAHPELDQRCRTKWEVRQAQQQHDWEARQADRAKKQQEWQQSQMDKASRQQQHQQAYAARKTADKEENGRRQAIKMRHSAEEQELRHQFNSCWETIHELEASRSEVAIGDYDQLNRIRAEINEQHENKNSLKAQEVALDHQHDEEMFNYVQDNEHDGRVRDGSWVDLHGCEMDYVQDYLFPQFLLHAVDKKHAMVEVITGAGNHSEGGHSAVKAWVWKDVNSFLNRAKRGGVPGLEGLDIDESDGNEGSVKVVLSAVKPS